MSNHQASTLTTTDLLATIAPGVTLLRDEDNCISPVRDGKQYFVIGVDEGVEREATCDLPPTATLYRDGTAIRVWAFSTPVDADDPQLAALAEALGMERTDEHIPDPDRDGWEIVKLGLRHDFAEVYGTYVGAVGDAAEAVNEPTEGGRDEVATASEASSDTTEPQMYGDATCVTPYDEAEYGKEIIVTIGGNRQSKNWKPETMPVGKLFAVLSKSREGKKDGLAFIPGDAAPGRRVKAATKALYFGVLDLDTGTPIAEIDAALKKLGCAAVRYTTYTHGKTQTDIRKDKVVKWAGDVEVTTELMRRFVFEVEKWHSSIVDHVEYIDTDHTENGIVCQIAHPPMPKNRIVIPFDVAFVMQNEGKTQAEAIKRWAKVLEALARLLNVPFDTSCTDPSRLFYFPRHAKGKSFSISLFGGPYFDWRKLELDDPMERLGAALTKGKSKSVTEKGRELGRWHRSHGHGFQIADVVEAYADERIRHRTGHGLETECPFDENHHNAGAQDDRACLVVNAGEGPSEFFTIKCQHESCGDKTMLDHLGKMLTDGWFGESVIWDEQFNAILDDGEGNIAPGAPEERDDILRSALESLSEKSTHADVESVIGLVVDADLSESRLNIFLQEIVEFTGGRKSVFSKSTVNAMLGEVRRAKATKHVKGAVSTETLFKEMSMSLGRPFEFPPKHLGNFSLCKDEQGDIWLCSENDGGGQVRLCAPFVLVGGVIYADRNRDRAHRIEIMSPEEKWIKLDIESGKLATVTPVLEDLMNAGFAMTEQGRQFVPRYLAEARPRGLTVYHRAGFRDGCFVLPTGEVLLTDRHVELAENVRLRATDKRSIKGGSLEGWKAATKALYDVPQAWRHHAGIQAGLAGPLCDATGDDPLMFAFWGGSTQGKSTAQGCGVASWGDPNLDDDGLFRDASGTKNSLELGFEVSSGTVLAYDEIGKLSAADQAFLVFMNQAGSGKRRMNRQGSAQKTRKWGGLALLVSAETTLVQQLRAENVTQLGGLSVRMFPIMFDKSAVLPAEQYTLTKAVRSNFGWSGPAFVEALAQQGYVSDPSRLRAEIEVLISELPGTEGAEGAFRRRAARPLGYLWKAGLIAAEAGLLPAGYDQKALALRLWEDARVSDIGPTDPLDRAVENLIDTITARKGREIVAYGERDERGVREALGYFDAQVNVTDAEGEKYSPYVYVIRSTKLAELSGGAVSERALRTKLKDKGILLMPPKGKSTTWGYFPGLGKAQYVVLLADQIDADVEPVVAGTGDEADATVEDDDQPPI